jgi:ABC-type uncharacterized transport system fused permease/ATPase subunit
MINPASDHDRDDAQSSRTVKRRCVRQVYEPEPLSPKQQDWEMLLSLREQQLLFLAHILLAAPRFAFLDRLGTALGSDQIRQILVMLSESSISYIVNEKPANALDLYDAVLDCASDGGWTWTEGTGRTGSHG